METSKEVEEEKGEKGIETVGTENFTKTNTTNVITSPLSSTVTSFNNIDNLAILKETASALEAMKEVASILIGSNLCPQKKVEDVILCILTGNQYGFHYMVSVNNIFAINGKPTLSTHLQRALLLRNKVIFEKIYDYEPMYMFLKTDSEGNIIKKENEKRQIKPIVVGKGTRNDNFENSKIYITEQPTDYITKYKFKRVIEIATNIFDTIEVYSSFSIKEAITAGLVEKDNWIKYPARMLDARAFTIGAREIASDITLGVYSVNELADAHGVNYTIDNNLQETIN